MWWTRLAHSLWLQTPTVARWRCTTSPTRPLRSSGGSVTTALGGIGAISADGTHVLVGEVNGLRAALIDISNPASPQIKSVFATAIDSIGAIALKGSLAVASGPNNFYFVVLDYANPASPTQIMFTPGSGGVHFGGAVTCDLDGTHAALADLGGGAVYLFDVSGSTPVLLGQFQSTQLGVSSISISGSTVAAASSNDFTVTLVSFQNPANPAGVDTPSNRGSGLGRPKSIDDVRLERGRFHDRMDGHSNSPLQGSHRGSGNLRLAHLHLD